MVILGVALAGGVGAVIRWLISARLADRTPGGTGTATVNLAGCLALGTVVALTHHARIGPEAGLVLGTGLLGAMTTFSTWMVETLETADGTRRAVLWRVVAPTLAGVALVWVGIELGGGI